MIKIGLDVTIYMAKNRKQVLDEKFYQICKTGWVENEYGEIDFEQPCEVYYARKFWDLYEPMCVRLDLGNGEFSQPLTKDDIEEMIKIATHNPDYFGEFETVPALCKILQHYDEATAHGMVFIFEGDY